MKWEYWKAELPTREKEIIPYLDKFGSEGWELVSVDNGIAYFKRQYNIVKTKQKRYGYDTVQDGYVIYDNYTLVKLSGLEVETLLNNE